MLPDFPELKSEISDTLFEFLRLRISYHLGPLSEIRHIQYFESTDRRVRHASGETEEHQMRRMEAEMTIKHDEFPNMTLEKLLEKLDHVAQEMARQMAQYTYQTISEATAKVGNVIDAKRAKLSAETILEALTKIQIDFDSVGRPKMPSVHVHPNLESAVLLTIKQFDENPALKKQFREIIQRKKEEWRAREASRRLVG